MGLFDSAFSADPTAWDVGGVKAGDAAEMESRLQALIDSSANPTDIIDFVLGGVGQGPEWQAALVFDVGGGAQEITRSTGRVAAAVAGSRTEAYLALLNRLRELNTESAISVVGKVEVAGGGNGSSFMAAALVGAASA